MRTPVVRSRATCLLLLCSALAPRAFAQDALSGAEQHVLVASKTLAAGGLASSESFGLRLAVGDEGSSQRAQADGLSFIGGVAWLDGALGAGPPVLFQVVAASGEAQGGESVRALGFNFDAPGSGATAVTLAGELASDLFVSSNTSIELTTPPGTNVHGNPLGPVQVEVLNQLGAIAVPDAYDYLPSLTQRSEAQVGEALELLLHLSPPELAVLAIGIPVPGLAISNDLVAQGALEIPIGLQLLAGPAPVATSEHVYVLPVPANPGLAGKTVSFQAAALGAFDGSFTNRLDVLITP